jgi:hypothetical protein
MLLDMHTVTCRHEVEYEGSAVTAEIKGYMPCWRESPNPNGTTSG